MREPGGEGPLRARRGPAPPKPQIFVIFPYLKRGKLSNFPLPKEGDLKKSIQKYRKSQGNTPIFMKYAMP